MNLGRALRRSALGLLGVFALMQAKQVEHSNPPVRHELDAPEEVRAVLRRSCYDCHSHETRWPWYSYVAPMSWFVAHHVEEGREGMNFSNWPRFDPEGEAETFEEIRKQVSRGKMPLKSYLLLHPDARLSEADKAALLRWAGEDS